MEISVMITNGGPHSAEKWAETTASHIVTIADTVAGEKRGAAIKLQAAVYDILLGHHNTVQHGERNAIKKHGVDRLQHDMTPEDHVDLNVVISEIIAAAEGTPWEVDFKKPEMADGLRVLLTDHFMQNAFIERSWHADKNIHTPQAQAFHKQFHTGVKE
jgi:hypothetical protein